MNKELYVLVSIQSTDIKNVIKQIPIQFSFDLYELLDMAKILNNRISSIEQTSYKVLKVKYEGFVEVEDE